MSRPFPGQGATTVLGFEVDRFSFLPQMKDNKSTPFYFDNTEAWATDSFFVLGIVGFFLYFLLGLTSLPSVGGSLSWREFTFVQVSLTYPRRLVPHSSTHSLFANAAMIINGRCYTAIRPTGSIQTQKMQSFNSRW